MALSLSTTFTGRVVSVNDKGVKLDGHPEWLNFSKFAEGLVAPERGATVTVLVDRQGFIRACELADGSAVSAAAPSAQQPASSQKDRTITRLAVLKAAAEFAASREGLKSGEVLKIAASWERWVLRSDGPAEDNVDAF
jgi:hypothetical protein